MSTTNPANINPTAINHSEAPAPVLSEFGLLTLLLRLLVILKNGDGDASIYGFSESEAGGRPNLVIHESDFALLDSISAIAVQQHEIVAACYQEHPLPDVVVPDHGILLEGAGYLKIPLLLVANFDYVGQNCGSSTYDYAFPVSTNPKLPRFKPKFAVTVNPRSGSSELAADEGSHNLRLIKIGGHDGHWKEVMSNPLCRMIACVIHCFIHAIICDANRPGALRL